MRGLYETMVDRESAYELLQKKAQQAKTETEAQEASADSTGGWRLPDFLGGEPRPARAGAR